MNTFLPICQLKAYFSLLLFFGWGRELCKIYLVLNINKIMELFGWSNMEILAVEFVWWIEVE